MHCCNCGAFFSEYEIVTKRGELGERLACCPICGNDDMEDSYTCRECGKEFEEAQLSSGYCIDCLWDAIDYEVAHAYLKESDLLTQFMVSSFFGAGTITESSQAFDDHMDETFLRMVANDKLLGWHEFLDCCREFCLPSKTKGFNSESEDFAEWYAKYAEQKIKDKLYAEYVENKKEERK